MKRTLIVLTIAAVAFVTTAQTTSLIAKYLQRYAAAPTCARTGQLYYDTGLGKSRICTATGAPGTWETVSSGTISAITSINGDTTAAQTISATDATITITNAGATHSIGLPYKVYTATLTQTGTDAPAATVLANTFGGTLVWTYSADGIYTVTLAGAFLVGKTWGVATGKNGANTVSFSLLRATDNTMQLRNDTEFNENTVSVEIRAYP